MKEAKTFTDVEPETIRQKSSVFSLNRKFKEIKSDGRDAMLLTLLYLDLYWLEDYIILYQSIRAGDLETKQN